MFKKIFSILLSIIMIVSTSSFMASALNVMNDIDLYQKIPVINENGMLYEKTIDPKGNEISLNEDTTADSDSIIVKRPSIVKATNIPSTWDSRNKNYITSVKNQGSFGTCWAFSFCATAESSLVSQGYTANTIDLSEAQIISLRDIQNVNPSTEIQRDGYKILSDVFNDGGNIVYAAATAARWTGLTDEAQHPYISNTRDYRTMLVNDSAILEHTYDLNSVIYFNNNDIDTIKNAIIENGAVAANMYYDSASVKYYNNEATHYQTQFDSSSINHAITVVGWDDNFSADNFKTKPTKNGAWLIKNSWGSSTTHNGFCWVSYYDKSLCDFASIIAKPSQSDNIYQYDGAYSSSGLSFTKNAYEANIYKASNYEKLDSCSFNIFDSTNYKCTAYVYTNLTNSNNPTSGKLIATASGNYNHAGFYTLELKSDYILSPNETFSIIIQYQNLDSNYGKVIIPIEGPSNNYYTYGSKVGQSFYSNDNKNWLDCNSNNRTLNNAPIKVHTSTIESLTTLSDKDIITIPDNTSTEIDYTQHIISGLNPGTTNLNSCVKLADGYHLEYSKIGTDTEVGIFYSNIEVAKYKVLIYGDVNGDGWYDGQDAVIVNCITNNAINGITALQFKAADCNHDGIVNKTDSDILTQAGLLLTQINQSSNSSILTTQYFSLIKQSDITENTQDDHTTNPESTTTLDSNENADTPAEYEKPVSAFVQFFRNIAQFFTNLFSFLF